MDPEGLAGENGREWPKTYYGQVQKKSVDLQTNACVTAARLVPKHQWEEALKNTLEEVVLRYYGCGLIIPEYLENCWILDLGSENGRDCYAQIVGEKAVTEIDVTEGQVAKALALFRLILLFLRGGELYFSDVYTSLELPEEIRTHKILWGRLPGGALYWKDFVILTSEIAFCPSRLVTANLIIHKKELERVIGDCRCSASFHLFKLLKTELAKRCVIYNGGITGHEKELILDANFTFKDLITDPFKLVEESDNMKSRCSPDVARGCCGTKKSC
ncbi:LOW QUALITY PROTEIN: arsenite methyltransferase [Hipposideros larvatus]